MTKVAVLSGGNSDEREVSLRSGQAVAVALRDGGYEVVVLDPSRVDSAFEAAVSGCDVVFLALHGTGGEDGSIQGWLEQRGIRYIGSDSRASELCFNKAVYKASLESAAIRVPSGKVVNFEQFLVSPLTSQPFVLKPFDGGSSVDTFVVRDINTAADYDFTSAFTKHSEMLLEELITGVEITVGIVNDSALPVIEIIPPTGAEFDYENKYNGATQELCPPQHVSPVLQLEAQELAVRVHNLVGCRDLSRTDMIIKIAPGETGPEPSIFVLETNTIPGLTSQSLLPKAAANAGMSMAELCDILIKAALQRPVSN